MNRTSIEWTTFSANPLKYRDADGRVVWACVHASPGCINCYAEAQAHRYNRGGPFNVPTTRGLTPFLDDAELHKMLTAKTIKKTPVSGSRCFVGDMTDIFGDWVPDELLDRLFAVFALRRDVTWQLLTKRADRMRDYCSRLPNRGCNQFVSIKGYGSTTVLWGHMDLQPWPLPNVWLGVSCEDQKRTDERLPLLLQTPAAVRFISAEPLLSGLDIAKHRPGANRLWVIVGGESGHGARECHVWWMRNIVRQCQQADVPVFVKQLGSHVIDRNDAGFDGDPEDSWTGETRYEDLTPQGWQGDPVRIRLRDRKGGDMSEWPADIRVRQFPQRGAVHA